MGITAKTKSLVAYHYAGTRPIDPRYDRFQRVSGEGVMGFVNIFNPLTLDHLEPQPFEALPGGSVATMRLDKRIVPGKVLAQKVGDEITRILDETNRAALTRSEKKQITERIRGELLAKTPITPIAVDVAISNQTALVFSSSAKAGLAFDEIMAHYGNYFVQLDYFSLAKLRGFYPDQAWDTPRAPELSDNFFAWLLSEDGNGWLSTGDKVVLADQYEKITIQSPDLRNRLKDIAVQFRRGLRITHMNLEIEGLAEFTLDRNFRFTGFKNANAGGDAHDALVNGVNSALDVISLTGDALRDHLSRDPEDEIDKFCFGQGV